MFALALAMVVYILAFVVPRHKLALEAARSSAATRRFQAEADRLRLHRLDRDIAYA